MKGRREIKIGKYIISSQTKLTISVDRDPYWLIHGCSVKKRQEGEVWTQPSGRKVTKCDGKIIDYE